MNLKLISFFGPPGSGKGTVAKRCVRDFGFIMLSTGDLARKHIGEKTEIGKILDSYVSKGNLIPDDIITKMAIDWILGNISFGKTIILDGFPRTKGQADCLLNSFNTNDSFDGVDFSIISFELSEDEIVKRVSGRSVCSNKSCGEIYSDFVKPPVKSDICDLCGSELFRREDDREYVVRKRLRGFKETADDLLLFYDNSGVNLFRFKVPEGGL